jgi:hypothetical protein
MITIHVYQIQLSDRLFREIICIWTLNWEYLSHFISLSLSLSLSLSRSLSASVSGLQLSEDLQGKAANGEIQELVKLLSRPHVQVSLARSKSKRKTKYIRFHNSLIYNLNALSGVLGKNFPYNDCFPCLFHPLMPYCHEYILLPIQCLCFKMHPLGLSLILIRRRTLEYLLDRNCPSSIKTRIWHFIACILNFVYFLKRFNKGKLYEKSYILTYSKWMII